MSAVGEEYLVTGFVAVAAYALAARPDLGSWQQRFDQVAAQFATTCTG